MRILTFKKIVGFSYFLTPFFTSVYATETVIVDQKSLGFKIPTLSLVLTFAVRAFFGIAGLAALLYLLMGAMSWITSGGNKENVEKAQQKIQQAVIGVILIVVVLAIVATLEQVAFKGAIGFGLTKELTVPVLLEPVTK